MTGRLDRERARTVLTSRLPDDPKWVVWVDGVLDELEGCVQPQGIDRDLLALARRRIAVLYMAGSGGEVAALDLRLAIDEIDAALGTSS